MKILILTSGVFPDSHSGIPKLVFYTARELRKMGHEIVVLTRQYQPSHPAYEEVEGMRYHRVFIPKRGDILQRFWPLIMPLKSVAWQRKIWREHKDVDVIWVHNPLWLLMSDPKHLWPRSKLIYEMVYRPYSEIISNHGSGLQSRLVGSLLDRVIVYIMKRRADAVSVISWFVYRQCLSMLGARHAKKIHVITPGADPTVFYPVSPEEKKRIRRTLEMDADRISFITARGLKGRTGVDKLIGAASLLKREGIAFSLIIVGSGPMKGKLEEQIAASGLNGHVRILSNVSEETLAAYYRASDAFVLPTQGGEGFGLATAEALASGLVAFGTGNGATTEILEKYNPQWLIHGTDEKHIFEKMHEFCRHPGRFSMPPERIRQITMENYTWEVGARDFLRLAGKLRG